MTQTEKNRKTKKGTEKNGGSEKVHRKTEVVQDKNKISKISTENARKHRRRPKPGRKRGEANSHAELEVKRNYAGIVLEMTLRRPLRPYGYKFCKLGRTR